MDTPITVEWQDGQVSHVTLDPSWRDAAERLAGEVVEQFNAAQEVQLTLRPRFGSVLGMSMDELRALGALLDAYNAEAAKLAERPAPVLTAGEAYREDPIVAHYANNRIFHLEIPADWLDRAPAQAVVDKVGRLLQRLPITPQPKVPTGYLKAVQDLEAFWGGNLS